MAGLFSALSAVVALLAEVTKDKATKQKIREHLG